MYDWAVDGCGSHPAREKNGAGVEASANEPGSKRVDDRHMAGCRTDFGSLENEGGDTADRGRDVRRQKEFQERDNRGVENRIEEIGAG